MTCLMPSLRVMLALRHPFSLCSSNSQSNILSKTQDQRKWLLLFPCACLGIIQWDNNRETMLESKISLRLSHVCSYIVINPSTECETSNILKSGKLRSLFQWGSRAARAHQPPRPPAPGKGSPGKGKSEDELHAPSGTASRRNTSSSSSSDSSCSSRGSHSSGHSRRGDDHDHGVDWDW